MATAVPLFLPGGNMNIKDYLKSISVTFDILSNKKLAPAEISRIGKADLTWANKKLLKPQNTKTIRKGDIIQFEFGKNLEPEMSYEHRGIIIGKSKQLLYVLPIFSYQEEKHKKYLYDKTDRCGGSLYLMKGEDYKFLKHDSVLKIDDLRSLSTKRILYRYNNGHIDIQSEVFKEITILAFSRIFPEYHYELNQLRNGMDKSNTTPGDKPGGKEHL